MSDLWGQIMEDADGDDSPVDYAFEDFDRFFTQRANGSFCQNSDELPRRRAKVVHTQGLVARVEWEPVGDHNWTGMLGEGSDHVILRMSETKNLVETSTGLSPSLALKFLVDGDKSKNLFAMPRDFLHGNSWDYFANPMSNRITPFEEGSIEEQTLQKKMVEATKYPFGTAIGLVGSHHVDGSEITNNKEVKIPYEIEYRGTTHFSAEKETDADGNQVMWYDQLRTLQEGSTIMEVWGLTHPEALDGIWVHMANIKLMTPLYTSNFGDTRLYFQHTRLQRDRRYWHGCWRQLEEDPMFDQNDENEVFDIESMPEWPDNEEDAEALYTSQMGTFGCPFAWLLNQYE